MTDTLLNPTWICEILSPTTEAYDRGEKFEARVVIPSLECELTPAEIYLKVFSEP